MNEYKNDMIVASTLMIQILHGVHRECALMLDVVACQPNHLS